MDWSGSPVTHRFPARGHVLGDQVLRVVGVLVLVHEHVEEAAAEPLARLGNVAEQADHEDEQVVEIRGVGAAEQPLVALEDLADGERLLRRAGLLEFLGPQSLFLAVLITRAAYEGVKSECRVEARPSRASRPRRSRRCRRW